MIKSKILTILAIIGGTLFSMAQQVPMTSSYNLNYFRLNPAVAGYKGDFHLFTHYRNQFGGFQGAPVTMSLTGDGMIKDKNFGLGGEVFNQTYDVLSKTGLQVAYAYNIAFKENSGLRLGLAASFSQLSIDFDKLDAQDQDELTLLTNRYSNSIFDADFGLFYYVGGLELGLSIPQVMQSSTSFEGTRTNENLNFTNNRQYVPMISYNWDVNEKWMIKPTVLSRISSGIKPQIDALVTVFWDESIFVNVGYHHEYAMVAGLGASISDRVILAYNYGYPLNEIAAVSSGSHEVTLGIRLSGKGEGTATTGQDGEYREKYEELKARSLEQEKINIRQKEEIERLQAMLGENKQSEELRKIRENSEAVLSGEREAEVVAHGGYVVVLGAFQNLENAISYKQLLKRLDVKEESRVIKATGSEWHLVYLEAYNSPEEAKKGLQEVNKKNIAMDSWIYVREK